MAHVVDTILDYCLIDQEACQFVTAQTPPNWFDQTSMLFYLSCVGGIVTAWTLGTACRREYRRFRKTMEKLEETELPYECLYEEELVAARENNPEVELTEARKKELHLCHIEDKTPRGDAIMLYDDNTESFWWFSDTKDVPYKYLETLCRKYILAYDCIGLYNGTIDELRKIEKEKNEKNEKKNEENNSTEEEKSSDDDSVFVSFKKYNRKGEDSTGGNDVIIPEKSNRYSYRGKMPDWEELQKERARIHIPEESSKNNLDFIAFKQMQQDQEK
jgi:hypothetical protein